MCGIAGIFHYRDPERPLDRNLLRRMIRSIRHRGPDDEGFYLQGNIGLAHCRLSIVDTTPSGHQPMSNQDGSWWISYNGEFYTHAQYRKALEAKGHRFRGSSDTETLLHLLEDRGPGVLEEVAGIFAFSLWDVKRQTLTLARDPLGVKQLYYFDDGETLLFASEMKALLQAECVPRHVDAQGVSEYLHFHTPLFDRTFWSDIRQVRAGEFIEVDRNGLRSRRYWSLEAPQIEWRSADEASAALRRELTTVVNDQLMSDVPVGVFFSGGIDSCTIGQLAAQASVSPLRCFGAHFSGQGVEDERPFQEAAAKALGLHLDLVTMDGSTFPEDLFRLMEYQDQPVIGAAMFPMHKVAALAAGSVKVCLGGQAADEVFAGYPRYGFVRPFQLLSTWFQRSQPSQGAGPGPPVRIGGSLLAQLRDPSLLARLRRVWRHFSNWEDLYFENMSKVPARQWNSVFADPAFVARDERREHFHQVLARSAAADPIHRVMLWDVQTYLTGLFQQDDRMSMAVSLESRVPFADPRVVRLGFQIDPALKIRSGTTKWILRHALADSLPAVVVNRPKTGFATPVKLWLEKNSSFVRETLLSSKARQRGFWNVPAVEFVLDHRSTPFWTDIVWKMLSVEVWARVFCDAGATGDSGGGVTPACEAHEPVH